MTDKLIERNPDMLGGTPVFSGTRVPVRILMEHLAAGDRLDEFLEDYPTVTRDQAVKALERATTALVGDAITVETPIRVGSHSQSPMPAQGPKPLQP